MADKTTIGLIAAVVCIGLVSIAGVFLPQTSQNPQQVENKIWRLKQNLYGMENDDIWITIESDVWRLTWYSYPVENLYNGVPWPVPYSYFSVHVYSYPGDELVTMGYSVEGLPISDVEYIIQGGQFYIQILTRDIKNWELYIYEYR